MATLGPICATAQTSAQQGIQVVRAEDRHGSVVGLIYPVEVLTSLMERHTDVPPRIAQAVRERTPIVVMWSIPGHQHSGLPSHRYEVSITEADQQVIGNPHRIDPVWSEEGTRTLLELSKVESSQEVASMAAFPVAAFVPGRKLIVYCQEPATADGMIRNHERGGWIRWGTAPHSSHP